MSARRAGDQELAAAVVLNGHREQYINTD